ASVLQAEMRRIKNQLGPVFIFSRLKWLSPAGAFPSAPRLRAKKRCRLGYWLTLSPNRMSPPTEYPFSRQHTCGRVLNCPANRDARLFAKKKTLFAKMLTNASKATFADCNPDFAHSPIDCFLNVNCQKVF
ncbi:MAG: hypothetical protein AAGA30_18510, partial [Planctomycetota bacterium]